MANLLADAYHAGTKAALENKPGQLFLGAHGAATSAGYPWSGAEREVFVKGYLDVIKAVYPQGILVDAEGKLIDHIPTHKNKAGPDAITALKAIIDGAQDAIQKPQGDYRRETLEWIVEVAEAAIRKEEV